MVRHYKKKSKKLLWSDGQMKLAIDDVKNGKSIASAAIEFGVPRSTLQLKIEELNKGLTTEGSFKKDAGFKRTFTDAQEAALRQYIIIMETQLRGYSSKDVRRLAFDFATKLGINHNFSDKNNLAGKDWLQNFMQRHNLSCRKAEHTSKARALGFNEKSVTDFFLLLQELQNKYQFEPANIYNVDETGISVVPKSVSRIVARKGRKQVGGLTAAERGETVTAEICMSASGKFMPPMLIFPRAKEHSEYLVGAPPGSWAEFHKSGWIQEDIFTRWFIKFVEFSHPTKEKPVLLLLDGHATHVKNLKVIDLAIENNVLILCFPPHCTHRLQPLDVSFMKPLSHYYSEEVSTFQRKGCTVTIKNIFSLFGNAFMRAAKVETAYNGFKKTGIYPINSAVFSKSDYATTKENDVIVDNNSKETGMSAEVQKYYNIIKEMENPTASSSTQPSHDLPKSKSAPCHLGEITIPVDYIVQAKPLINLLSSTLALLPNAESTSSLVLNSSSSDKPIAANTMSSHTAAHASIDAVNSSECSTNTVEDTSECIDRASTINFSCDTQLVPGTLNESSKEIHLNEQIPKKSRCGKTAIVTSDDYKTQLMAQKIKKIKTEPKEPQKNSRKKVKVLSDITNRNIISLPQNSRKRKAPGTPKTTKRSAADSSYEVIQEILVPSTPQPQDNLVYQLNGTEFIVQPLDDQVQVQYIQLPYGAELISN